MKTLTALALVLFFAFQTPAATYAREVNVAVNGVLVEFELPTVSVDGHFLVHIDPLAEMLGAEVVWTPEYLKISGGEGIQIIIGNGAYYMTVNGEAVSLEVPSTIADGFWLYPLEMILQAFGKPFSWDGETGTINITIETDEPRAAADTPTQEEQPAQERPTPTPTPTPAPLYGIYAIERAVLYFINIERAKYGAPPLVWHDDTAYVSRAHSRERSTRYLSHTGADGSKPWDRLNRAGIEHSRSGEIMGNRNTRTGARTWYSGYEPAVSSPYLERNIVLTFAGEHREILLNPYFSHAGVGIVEVPHPRMPQRNMFTVTVKFILID